MTELTDIRPAYLEVDVDRVLHNIRLIKNRVGKDVKIMVSSKGNFYGLGVKGLLEYVEPEVDYFAVAMVSEAIQLRKLGAKKGILILGATPIYQYKYLLEYDVMPSIFSYEDAKILSDLALEKNKKAKIHIKLDTGMTRIGFDTSDESVEEVEKISKLPGIEIHGTFTHFSSADECDKKEVSKKQAEIYYDFCNRAEAKGIKLGKKHMCNSGAIIELPEFAEDMVRPGFSVMGLVEKTTTYENLPVLSTCQLKAKIVRIRQVKKGTKISYNCTYEVEKDDTRIATIPIGYADGYNSLLSNRGEISVNGKRAKICGKICMDQFMVDVTDIDCKPGDEVIIFGYENNAPSILELSEIYESTPINAIASLARRVPRVYLKDGEIVKIIDELLE